MAGKGMIAGGRRGGGQTDFYRSLNASWWCTDTRSVDHHVDRGACMGPLLPASWPRRPNCRSHPNKHFTITTIVGDCQCMLLFDIIKGGKSQSFPWSALYALRLGSVHSSNPRRIFAYAGRTT